MSASAWAAVAFRTIPNAAVWVAAALASLSVTAALLLNSRASAFFAFARSFSADLQSPPQDASLRRGWVAMEI